MIMPVLLLVLALAAPLSQADPEFIQLDPMRSMTQPFSDAVVIGDLMLLSGQVGTNASDQLVKGGLVAEPTKFSRICELSLKLET